jgi:regulatory protein
VRPSDQGADPPAGVFSYDAGWRPAAQPIPGRRSSPRAADRLPAPTDDSRAPRSHPSRPPVRRGSRGEGEVPGHPEDPLGDPESVARAVCLRLLTLQPRTRAELAAALAKRGVPDEAATTVLSRFTDVGLIDDRAFAAAWVDSRHAGRGLSRRALASELHRRGIDGEIVDAAVSAVDAEAEERAARQLVDRRLASTRRLDQPARLRRLAGMLARKGYPGGLAVRVVRAALAAEGADPGELGEWDDPTGDE